MTLVPWTTSECETITNELSEIIHFFVTNGIKFLTLPALTIEVGFVYNYDIVVYDSDVIIATEKPSELTFIQYSATTAKLSGVFYETGSYQVKLSAFDCDNLVVEQNFIINVTDKYNIEDIDVDDRFDSLGDGLLILFEQVS